MEPRIEIERSGHRVGFEFDLGDRVRRQVELSLGVWETGGGPPVAADGFLVAAFTAALAAGWNRDGRFEVAGSAYDRVRAWQERRQLKLSVWASIASRPDLCADWCLKAARAPNDDDRIKVIWFSHRERPDLGRSHLRRG